MGKTVLIGWELGGGLGHVQKLLHLARALTALGHQPVFAVKNLVEPWPVLLHEPFPVLQAPYYHPPPALDDRPFSATSYADVLARRGFAAVEDLWPMVQGWQHLFDLLRPALVVCDHSPTLCLAAYRRLPTVLLGTGFSVPPAETAAFPPLVPGQATSGVEEQLLPVVQEVQRRRGAPAPDTLPGLFAQTYRFVTVLPDLDPYRSVRHEPQLGPLEPLLTPLPRPDRPRFFAYLSAEAAYVGTVLASLGQTGYSGIAYIRGAPPALRERLRRPGLEVLDAPAPLSEVLPGVSVLVHHGGVGAAQQALSAGRPQLLIPRHLEQALYAQALHGLGVAHFLAGQPPVQAFPQALEQLIADPRFTEQALAVAHSVQARGPWNPLPRILESCVALLGAT